jgi:Tfp pilus assembly protein PilX
MSQVMNLTNEPLPETLPSGRVRGGREKEQKVMDKKSNLVLRNESGAALVVALLMIVVLSLIGLASSSSSTFEIRLSGNKRGATNAFYSADAGAIAVVSNIANFNSSSGYVTVASNAFDPVINPGKKELGSEQIDTSYTVPQTKAAFSLPGSVDFSAYPTVTIYHSTGTKVPRGLGLSATAFQYNYYIVDAVGRDQMDVSLTRSNCEVREKIVRLIPTGN